MIEIIITGYGADDGLAFEARVPGDRIEKARALARVPDDDPDVWGLAWPLTETDAAALVGPVPPGLDYFLEAVSSGPDQGSGDR